MMDLYGVTTQLVSLAMDASVLRHQAIANNIANGSNSEYVPVRVNFEDQLSSAIEAVKNRRGETSLTGDLENIKPYLVEDDQAQSVGNSRVMLDMEMAKLAQNVVHYQALLKGLTKNMAIISLAINEGRR